MKINPDQILVNLEKTNLKTNLFLVSGNEETLILKIKKILIDEFKKKNFSEVHQIENIKIDENYSGENSAGLFSKKKILVYKNPNIKKINLIKNLSSPDTITIIEHYNLKSNDKIKKDFDFDKYAVSISCYKINNLIKKKIIDNFLSQNSISLSKDAYWYLFETVDCIYQILENELIKLKNYSKEQISLSEIKRILVAQESYEINNLFFLINADKKKLIEMSNKHLNSLADSIYLLQKIKTYLDLICRSKLNNDIILNLPKYMFSEKSHLEKIYKKISFDKVVKINNLIKKNETFQRKYANMHKVMSQRFLLNLKKIIY